MGTLPTDAMYKMKLGGAKTSTHTGKPIDTDARPLNLIGGWNWIPYHLQFPAARDDGLPVFSYIEGDYIKSQLKFAQHYGQYGWHGQLSQLKPGQGYMLKLNTDSGADRTGTATFNKDAPPANRRQLSNENTTLDDLSSLLVSVHNKWTVQPSKFIESMSVSAFVLLGGVPQA